MLAAIQTLSLCVCVAGWLGWDQGAGMRLRLGGGEVRVLWGMSQLNVSQFGICEENCGLGGTRSGFYGGNYGLKKTIPVIRSGLRTFRGRETSVNHYELRKPSFSARIVADCRPDFSLLGGS